MKRQFAIPGFALLVFAAAGAQVASHAPALRGAPAPGLAASAVTSQDKPVARVNGSLLSSADLLREEYAIFPYARQHNGIPKELAAQIHDGALKMLVFEELVYQEALRRKMSISAPKLQRAESDFRRQFATQDEFNAFLRSDFHNSEQLLQEKIRRSLLIEQLLRIEVGSKSKVTPAEVRAYYEKNPVRFQHPESFTFQTISVLPPPKATAEQLKEGRKRAEQALRQAKQTKTPEEFGLLAEKISDDDYRVMMGQHKPVPVDQLAPQVVKALLAMHPGEVSDVIPIEQAYTIVRLEQHTSAGKTKFEDVRVELTKELQQKKTNQLRMTLDSSLRQKAKIQEF